jgi:hypothetical protein
MEGREKSRAVTLNASSGVRELSAHSVRQRTKEIGVWIAIGAASHDIRRLVFGEGMRPVVFWFDCGPHGVAGRESNSASQLVGFSPYDPVTLVIAPSVLILVALLACQIPSQCAPGGRPSGCLAA